MKQYLLNVTFYAGSDDPQDTDRGLFLLSVDKEILEDEMKKIFDETNRLLNSYDDEDEERDFPISYEEGINIDTLMKGIEVYTEGKIEEISNNTQNIGHTDALYVIEQWQ